MYEFSNPKNNRWRIVAFGLGLAVAATVQIAPPVDAEETAICSMEVLVDGVPLKELQKRGTTYIEAIREQEYAVRLRNNTAHRVAVALSVDGLNSIDAKTTPAPEASKWVLGPYQTITVSGWQTSSTAARQFFFTTEDQSYGAWLGRTTNLGVIEAVAYRERRRRITRLLVPDSAPNFPKKRSRSAAGKPESSEKQSAGEALSDDLAATGIGRRIDNPVRRVHLDLETSPAAHLRLRYEYRQQLVHLGVIPSEQEVDALARRERAHGFSDFEFSPDPNFAGRR